MIWAGVTRVSDLRGRDASSDRFHSVADQEAEIQRACEQRGDTVRFLPPELDVSGGLPLTSRPALLEAVQGIEAGRYGGLAVAYMSRMGRDMRVLLEAWDRIEAAGGKVLAVREGIDTSTAAGRLQRDLLAVIDANQREQAAEGFDRRNRIAVEQGIWKQRVVPIGYRKDSDTRGLVPDVHAEAVRQAFRDRAAGSSLAQIAARLGMTGSGVAHMLKSRVYLGELRNGPHMNLVAHEPLVTVDEWQAAQIVSRPARRPSSGPALLAGLIRCQACGHIMSRSHGHRYYECRRVMAGTVCPAPTGIRLPALDDYVTAAALELLDRLAVTSTDSSEALLKARTELDEARRELSAYLQAVSAADIGADAFGAGARERSASCEAAARRVEQLAASGSPESWGAIRDEWGAMTGHDRNQLLRGLLDMVVIRRVGRGRRVPHGERVRVVLAGSGLVPHTRTAAGVAAGLQPIGWLDGDDPRTIRPAGSEQAPERVGG